MKVAVLALSLLVAGCATIPDRPPEERLTCASEPGVPPEPITDEKNGKYLRDLQASGADCRGALQWLKDFFDR